MKKGRNELLVFLTGIIMLVAGLYWFTSSVTVTTGFYSWRFGDFSVGGLVVVPLLAGIFWLFINSDSIGAKILIVLGIVIIIASIIAGTRFVFGSRNLYEYLLMLIFICGGSGLTLRVLFAKPKDRQ
jgi:hypothetical protein